MAGNVAGTTLPTNPQPGDFFIKTDAAVGQRLYTCATPGQWDAGGGAVGGGAPIGSILMWSALNGAIPAGWAECDGTANTPGPDLRDRFIVGRSGSKAVDTTGGTATHTPRLHPSRYTHTYG